MVRASLLGYMFLAAQTITGLVLPDKCPIFFSETQRKCDPIAPASFLPASINLAAPKAKATAVTTAIARSAVLADLLDALNVTQAEYFVPWKGTWPDAIDWTAAVLGTHISGVTRSISEELAFLDSKENPAIDWRWASNLIDKYFTQTVAYHFGQDAAALRDEAYDDMLWVVLGWLETVQFVDTHNSLYYGGQQHPHHPDSSFSGTPAGSSSSGTGTTYPSFSQPYHGNIWVPTFAHRAREFWDLAAQGWDMKLCGGGMVWNPKLTPYKNAITNELFIAASISMYLYFPEDDNLSPLAGPFKQQSMGGTDNSEHGNSNGDKTPTEPSGPRDTKYLKAAVEAYRWLRGSNMTNEAGLYVDGFHIKGYGQDGNNNTRCDERDEAVYSYNQGVVLSGQRGLWDATGSPSYLADGHRLIQDVIRATGYDILTDAPVDDDDYSHDIPSTPSDYHRRYNAKSANDKINNNIQIDMNPNPNMNGINTDINKNDNNENMNADNNPLKTTTTAKTPLPPWHGLGRLGILEDPGDASGTSSQDAQTFKGIFFHHLTSFCAPLVPPSPLSSPLPGPLSFLSHPVAGTGGRGRGGGQKVSASAFATTRTLHATACRAYSGWVGHNVRAALLTRDNNSGKFGNWWTAGLLMQRGWVGDWPDALDEEGHELFATTRRSRSKYEGVKEKEKEKDNKLSSSSSGNPYTAATVAGGYPLYSGGGGGSGGDGRQQQQQQRLESEGWLKRHGGRLPQQWQTQQPQQMEQTMVNSEDPNDRGRGRTVETQSGGLGLLRAYWKIARML